MKAVQERLGHESYSTTADIYAHLDSGIQEETGDMMDEIAVGQQKGNISRTSRNGG
jgi:integrase